MAEMTLPEKVVDLVGYSQSALEKAAAVIQGQEKRAAAITDLIPKVVNVMVEQERIRPDQREKLAEALQDPAEVLNLLMKVAGHRNREELSHLGEGVNGQTKTAGANGHDPSKSLTNPNVGRRTTMVKQSDVNFFSGLGLAPPTE